MSKKLYSLFIIIVSFFLLFNIAYAQSELPIGLQKLKQYEQELASSITLFIAFFAGLISMTSPCGIALLPTYFSVAFKDRKKSVQMAAAFSIGLLAAFTIFGLIAGMVGDFFNSYKLELAVVSGIAIALFGILLMLNSGFSIFNFRLDYSRGKGFFSIAMLGLFFGIGWTPCAGPILVGILILAANSATVLSGILMLLFYGLGVVAPLLLLSYFSDRYDWANSVFLRGRQYTFSILGRQISTYRYNLIGGIFLLILGILMVMYQGTFFFQTDLPRVIPWSMSLWAIMNEEVLESGFLTSAFGNILGFVVAVIIIALAVYLIKKGDKNENSR